MSVLHQPEKRKKEKTNLASASTAVPTPTSSSLAPLSSQSPLIILLFVRLLRPSQNPQCIPGVDGAPAGKKSTARVLSRVSFRERWAAELGDGKVAAQHAQAGGGGARVAAAHAAQPADARRGAAVDPGPPRLGVQVRQRGRSGYLVIWALPSVVCWLLPGVCCLPCAGPDSKSISLPGSKGASIVFPARRGPSGVSGRVGKRGGVGRGNVGRWKEL